MSRFSRFLLGLLAFALVASGCSLRTAGSPTGELTLVGRFETVQHLVVGHGVRISDITVGTVTGLKLDGYDAIVTMSIADGRDIPVGTIASVSSTSLLGENYVRLLLPPNPTGEMVKNGDELTTGPADASFEELTVQLLALLRAIQGRDVATVVNAGVDAIGNRGAELGQLIQTLDEVGDGLTGQSAELVKVLDSFVAFGESIADEAELLGDSIVRAADATGALAAQSDRIVQTFKDVNAVATALEAQVLIPHRAELDRILDRLKPIVSVLANERDLLIAGLDALRVASTKLPRVVENRQALSYGLVNQIILPGLPPLNLG